MTQLTKVELEFLRVLVLDAQGEAEQAPPWTMEGFDSQQPGAAVVVVGQTAGHEHGLGPRHVR